MAVHIGADRRTHVSRSTALARVSARAILLPSVVDVPPVPLACRSKQCRERWYNNLDPAIKRK